MSTTNAPTPMTTTERRLSKYREVPGAPTAIYISTDHGPGMLTRIGDPQIADAVVDRFNGYAALQAKVAGFAKVIDNDDLRDAAAYFHKEAMAERVLLGFEKGSGSRIALGQYERYEAAIRAVLASLTTPEGR